MLCNRDYISVDGDVLNNIAQPMKETELLFEGFEPQERIIDRTNGSIKFSTSNLESISLSIFSDH